MAAYASSVLSARIAERSRTRLLSSLARFPAYQSCQPMKSPVSLILCPIILIGGLEFFSCLCDWALTPWQTTQRGRPNGSSHSPSLRGSVTLLSLPAPKPPVSWVKAPLFRCCHSFMTCSMISISVLPRDEVAARSSLIQSRNCRTQCHGSDQSSRMTSRLCGIACGVKRGFSKGAKEDVDSERRWIDKRASMSAVD